MFIIAGLSAFPVAWLLLVTAQGVYFGPMRSAFEKIGRRYLDDLPFGWGLYDVLYYVLPLVGLVLIVSGIAAGRERRFLVLSFIALVGAVVVVGVRMWGPGYL